jgi:two-component system LytT family response regulator
MADLISPKQKIRTIIVDDEQPAQELLLNYICEYCPELEIVAVCGTAKSAFATISGENPQLVFLDVRMPLVNGFDLLRMFDPIYFKVIFVTGHSEYAIDAFRFAAVDFLLKPVKVSELTEAVNKVKSNLMLAGPINQLKTLMENISKPLKQNKNLIIADFNGFSVIKTDDIILCQAEGCFTVIYLINDELINSARNLKYFEEILDPQQFMRVHYSYLINLHHVKRYTSNDEIILTDDLKCNLSRSNKQEFHEYYKNRKS